MLARTTMLNASHMERAKVLTSNFEPVDGDLEVAGAEHGVGEGDDAGVALHGQSEQVVDEQAPEGGGGVDLHQEDGQVVHVEVLSRLVAIARSSLYTLRTLHTNDTVADTVAVRASNFCMFPTIT